LKFINSIFQNLFELLLTLSEHSFDAILSAVSLSGAEIRSFSIQFSI